jgi:predicted RNase H-like nuclease (RuvC/YqgF family)
MAKKDRETKQMQKSLEEQQKRVKILEQDIDKMKT